MGCSKNVVSVVWISFVWFLLVVSLLNMKVETRDIITVPSVKSAKFLKTKEIEKSGLRQNLNLNYVSKRRVPNGPDPIHNRRVGTTRLPPS